MSNGISIFYKFFYQGKKAPVQNHGLFYPD